MAKRNTKADRILNESAMRLEAARMREQLAQSQLNTAKAVLEAVRAAHDALTNELTAQPRKKAEKPSASAPALKEPTPEKEVTGGECAKKVGDHVCRLPRENALHHDTVYQYFHEFEPPKPAARAPRKSKPKPEIETDAAMGCRLKRGRLKLKT